MFGQVGQLGLVGRGRLATRLVSGGQLNAPLVLTRAQATGVRSTAINADAVTRNEFAADIARFNGVARRLLVEGQRTNGIRNPRAEGSTAGILGAGGVMPTNWTLAAAGLLGVWLAANAV